jgi:polar amino acid transport system ATP-binding protein
MLVIENLKKHFGRWRVFDDVSVTFFAGEIVAILGSSGAGKTTFLRCLCNLAPINSGSIEIQGVPLRQVRPGTIGLVSQHWDLFNNMTVYENVEYALVKVLHAERDAARKVVEALLNELYMLDKKGCYPQQLSGGQRQRVAIARAVAMNPNVILFDEPTSALDPEMTGQVLKILHLFARRKMLVLVASHDVHFVKKIATRVVFLRRGKIVEDCPCEQFFDEPHNPHVKKFLSEVVLL